MKRWIYRLSQVSGDGTMEIQVKEQIGRGERNFQIGSYVWLPLPRGFCYWIIDSITEIEEDE